LPPAFKLLNSNRDLFRKLGDIEHSDTLKKVDIISVWDV